MDRTTTERYIDAGADFVISPIMKPEMAEVCHSRDKHWIPGCATMTEIVQANDNGAEVIKIFPGSTLGPQFVSSVLSVVPHLKLMVTGGVEPEEKNLASWFSAGAMCVGLGSQLFSKNIVENNDYAALRNEIVRIIQVVKKLRS
jgi:2-dehydro-3-deoxyphosphogluconate aldolase / (4S)-4-hydroxy-2-oxoglutarate aldolase